MNTIVSRTAALFIVLLSGCGTPSPSAGVADHGMPADDYERGPHGGRLLNDGAFVLELSIFEAGVPPEFRAWATLDGQPVTPTGVDLKVRLTRLGNRIDAIGFIAQDDFLRGDQVVYEPHSFAVSIDASVNGATHHWEYDNFEGRTQIGAEVAAAFGLQTEVAGPAVLEESISVYGKIQPNAEKLRYVNARFPGVIHAVHAALGEVVKAGQPLAVIESDESLKSYTVSAPIGGIVTERNANAGEHTDARRLFTVLDSSTVWAELAIFPADRMRVQPGALVSVGTPGEQTVSGRIERINMVAEANQSVLARVVLNNADGLLLPGMFVSARIKVADHSVPLAVKRAGLQAFRDFTVVYAQVGDVYEVRMLELGKEAGEWVEVLGGLEPGTRYVTENSYLVKADIEKSGASHDH